MTLYLLASLEGRSDITTFAVHRISDADTTVEGFPDPGLDVDGYAAGAFGIYVDESAEEDVEVLFDADIAWLINERTFHPDEEKTLLEDGRLKYCVRTSGESEITSWLQTYGPLAELVRPESWRGRMADRLRETAARYEG